MTRLGDNTQWRSRRCPKGLSQNRRFRLTEFLRVLSPLRIYKPPHWKRLVIHFCKLMWENKKMCFQLFECFFFAPGKVSYHVRPVKGGGHFRLVCEVNRLLSLNFFLDKGLTALRILYGSDFGLAGKHVSDFLRWFITFALRILSAHNLWRQLARPCERAH